MTDYRAELQRLVQAYDEHGGKWPDAHEQALFQAVEAARTALAQPEPEVSPWPVPGDAEGLAEVFWSRFPTTPCHYPSNPTRDFNLEAPIDT